MQTLSAAPASSTEADGPQLPRVRARHHPDRRPRRPAPRGQPARDQGRRQAATHRVSAQRLGESPVVELAVLAKHPQTANQIATALGHQVVAFMNEAGGARFDTAIRSVDAQVATATTQRDKLQNVLADTFGLRSRTNVRSSLAAAQNTLDHLTDERSSLDLADANRDLVVAVDIVPPTVQRVASASARAALALLLGLLVGVAPRWSRRP